MRQLLILLLPMLLLAQELTVVRIESASRETIRALHSEGYDITASVVNQFCDISVTKEDSLSLASRFNLVTLVSGKDLANQRRVFSEKVRTAGAVRGYTEPRYIDYDTYTRELEDLQQSHPDIMKLMDLGQSQGALQNTPGFDHRIWGIKVSDNVSQNEAEPGFLFVGEHHARETQTFPVTFAFLKELLENYETDPDIRSYVDNNQIFFIPLMNPDGYTVATTENSMWRKNINSNGYSVSFRSGSYTGVDLNRNYRYKWGENAPNIITRETYRGPEAHSEPEIKAVLKLIEEQSISAAITFHSYSEIILMPFNQESNTEEPADFIEMKKLAEKMAGEMTKKNGYGTYEVGNAVDLLGYGAGGGMSDHIYVDYGIFAYCFELWNGGFQTPENQLPGLARNSSKACRHLIDRASYSTLQGVITADGIPVRAEITISGIDDNPGDRCNYFSNSESGFYCRFVSPGTYRVSITPENDLYPTKESEVVIYGDEVTVLDVSFGSFSETVELTVIDGSGSGEYHPGDTVRIAAVTPDENALFTGWHGLPGNSELNSFTTPVTVVIPDTNCTITALSEDLAVGRNRVTDDSWYMDSDSGSSVEIDSTVLNSDSLLTILFNRKNPTDENGTWTGSGTAPNGNYEDLTHLRIIYKSEDSCVLSLVQEVLSDHGADFGVTLPAVSEFTETILPVPAELWKQEEWVNSIDSLQIPLKAQSLTGVILKGFPGESGITIKSLNLVGFSDVVALSDKTAAPSSQLKILSTTRKNLSFVAPWIGNYRVRLFTTSGRIVLDTKCSASETGGIVSVPFSSISAHQMLLLEITGVKGRFFMKIIP